MSTPLVDVVLHIGSGKTGTTSIQQLLRHNSDRLATHGLLFPRTPGAFRNVRLGLYALPDSSLVRSEDWLRGDYPAPEVFRKRFRRRLLREIGESGASRVIFSDEGLYHVSAEAVGNLRALMDEVARSVRLVVYLRRQDDHLLSRYQQVVKMGESLPLSAWSQKDFVRTYDYHHRLSMWRRRLAPDAFVVRPFERAGFAAGSLFQDFLDAAGLDIRADTLAATETRNESLGAEAVETLRLLNLHRVEQGVERWQIRNRPYVVRLTGTDTGPTLSLPDAALDRFMARWEESNRNVAREFLDDPSGTLFHASRKTGGTTTEQVLEPARLDHYLDLLEIPPDQQAPIRRIAQREAARA